MKMKSIQKAGDYIQKVKDQMKEILKLKFDFEKIMAQIVPDQFGTLKLDAWQRFEQELSEELVNIKDDV